MEKPSPQAQPRVGCRTAPLCAQSSHLAHVMLAHGCDRAEYQLLAANTLERFLHFTQELLKPEERMRETSSGPLQNQLAPRWNLRKWGSLLEASP